MPIKSKRELKCTKCGKVFYVTMNDAIMPEDTKLLSNPICKVCKIKNKLKRK